jgi:hypothetical protein
MTLIPEQVDEYFRTARVRHQIYLDRKAGKPYPWTDDVIFKDWKFTNVFRELDKTTVWFRENVREPMRADPDVLLATIVFRMFNRIGTGEAIFNQKAFDGGRTAWEVFLEKKDTDHLKWAIKTYIGARGPYVTGAYIIQSPGGYNKVDGVLKIIEMVMNGLDLEGFRLSRGIGYWCDSLEDACNFLQGTFRYIGGFTAYEWVSDLRHTDLLCNAPDIMTWANAGPGATRGLNVLHGRKLTANPRKEQMVEEMRELLELSKDEAYWSWDWHDWEMREVEHWLCEYFKIYRAKVHGTMPRSRFKTWL